MQLLNSEMVFYFQIMASAIADIIIFLYIICSLNSEMIIYFQIMASAIAEKIIFFEILSRYSARWHCRATFGFDIPVSMVCSK